MTLIGTTTLHYYRYQVVISCFPEAGEGGGHGVLVWIIKMAATTFPRCAERYLSLW